jgi:predicted nucleic acid-binding Zn ribbon protein
MQPLAQAPDETQRRRRVRRTALIFMLVTVGIYVGFIAMMLARGAK